MPSLNEYLPGGGTSPHPGSGAGKRLILGSARPGGCSSSGVGPARGLGDDPGVRRSRRSGLAAVMRWRADELVRTSTSKPPPPGCRQPDTAWAETGSAGLFGLDKDQSANRRCPGRWPASGPLASSAGTHRIPRGDRRPGSIVGPRRARSSHRVLLWRPSRVVVASFVPMGRSLRCTGLITAHRRSGSRGATDLFSASTAPTGSLHDWTGASSGSDPAQQALACRPRWVYGPR